MIERLAFIKKNIYIEIARTDNPEFSSMNKHSAQLIYDVLSQYYQYVGISMIDNLSDLDKLVAKQPDLVFVGLKRVPTSGLHATVWVSEYLSKMGIAHTGSPKKAIGLELNKHLAKTIVKKAGLATAPFFTAAPSEYKNLASMPLPFPLFVKPLHAGGGEGIANDSVVHTFTQYQAKVASISNEFQSDSLAEEYLTGREFSVAILGNNADDQLVMPIEIITEANDDGNRILGWEVKTLDSESVVPVTDTVLRNMLITLARDVFVALGAKDVGRVDIRLDAFGKAQFLEANLVPGMGNTGGYFWQAYKLNQGRDYESMILRIAKLGLDKIDKLLPASPVGLMIGV